jgi:hypothetical protein
MEAHSWKLEISSVGFHSHFTSRLVNGAGLRLNVLTLEKWMSSRNPEAARTNQKTDSARLGGVFPLGAGA